MVLYSASGVLSALALARIQTLLSDAGQMVGTVCVEHTFWPTGGRGALVVWETGAGSTAVLDATLGVRSARTRLARVLIARRIG